MLVNRQCYSSICAMNKTFETNDKELKEVYGVSEENIKKLHKTGRINEYRCWGNGTTIVTTLKRED